MKILSGHSSPETAYLVEDHPYGFGLRCMIRYWLEDHPRFGTRMVSQTTNPKRPNLVQNGGVTKLIEAWNKPVKSTYAYLAGCLYLDDKDHVTWAGLSQYNTATEVAKWLDCYREGLSKQGLEKAERRLLAKVAGDRATAPGG